MLGDLLAKLTDETTAVETLLQLGDLTLLETARGRAAAEATRTGDARHAFLIRADGSVVSKSWWNGPLAQSFEGLRLNPGDTVVVPEQINKTTFLKELKDWSQVFAQFGLGAAAINLLK